MSAPPAAPATATTRAAVRLPGAGTIAVLRSRIERALGRRAARLRTALLVFSLLLPALLSTLFGRRG